MLPSVHRSTGVTQGLKLSTGPVTSFFSFPVDSLRLVSPQHFIFTTIIKITKEIFVKICWQLKTPTRTWKCTRCIMQMSYLYASDFSFKNFCKLAQHAETIRNKCLGKELWRVLVVDKSTDHYKPHFRFVFYHNINVKKMFFSERELKKALRDTTEVSSVVWTLIDNGKLARLAAIVVK